MAASNPGQVELYYAAHIGGEDVEGLAAFIFGRAALFATAERGSGARQMARAMKAAVSQLADTLEHALSLSEPEDERYRLVRRAQVVSAWNALWALASPWQGDDDYDGARWRHVKYWDASHEREIIDVLGEARQSGR
ncbi:hypothetical protein [Streptomyces purpureus]|uniref:hypothetical protein n=1 Tax=Streptomyces purpureus TaxID=1951 RepID=UPI00131A392A|nr:hypothetical protein [Streptomyces purpureus]